MLDELSKKYVACNFKVYDHNWLFYQNFLGEPFLINDIIIYFDGEILYVCAFSLENLGNKINLENIMPEIIKIISLDNIKAIDIWGNIDSNNKLFEKNKIIDYTPPINGMFDCVIDVEKFSLQKLKKARLAFQAAKNSKLRYKVLKRNVLLYEHIMLMRKFLVEHQLGGVSRQIFLSMGEAIKLENAYLVEAYNFNGQLIGFALLTIPSEAHAIYTLACFDNSTRASDIVMYASIEFCKKNKIQELHLGYSATKGLLNFKMKWGGSAVGQEYEEYFLNVNQDNSILKHINKGTFLWRNRLSLGEDG